MNNHMERPANRHPSAAELDRLRAGLLDREPAVREALTEHLSRCETCRAQVALWPRLATELERMAPSTASSLALRRERALRGLPAGRSPRTSLALALAAGIGAIAVGVGVLHLDNANREETSTAAEAPGPDLYVDLDFYLWLLHKRTNEGAPPNS